MANIERIGLWIVVLSLAAWGSALLLVPGFIWETLGGAEPVSAGYSRYAGAWFLGVTIAGWAALRGDESSTPVFVIAMVGASLSAIVLLADLLGDNMPTTNDWIVWLAIVNAVVIADVSFLALRAEAKARTATAGRV